jgi:hypothetical protein
MKLFKTKRETKSLSYSKVFYTYLTAVVVSTVAVVAAVSVVAAVESQHTAVESVVVVSVFSAPLPHEAKKIVADAKSMNVIFFIIVFCFLFCKLFVFVSDIIYYKYTCLF